MIESGKVDVKELVGATLEEMDVLSVVSVVVVAVVLVGVLEVVEIVVVGLEVMAVCEFK